MNSPNANIFLALQQRIAGLKDGTDRVYFRTVDHDLQQLNLEKPPVTFPCVLIGDFNFDFMQMSANTQTGKGSVTLKICFTPYSSSESKTPVEYLKKAINYYELEQLLHLALQGWHPALMEDNVDLLGNVAGSLNRIASRAMPRNDDIIVRQVTYSISIDDFSTKPIKGKVPRPAFVIAEE